MPRNRLLGALCPADREWLLSQGKIVLLPFGRVLAEPGQLLESVYFPLSGFISLFTAVDERHSIEVGLIGNEGMVGSSLALGVDSSPVHALVQGPGKALQLEADVFETALGNSATLQRVMQRYLHVVLGNLAQAAACSRFHLVEARLARWLLMTQDRAHSPDFHLTHELLAHMLGVRRVGVTKAATALQQRRLIRYSRGDITVLDRTGLERASCTCYRADRALYEEILGSRQSRGKPLETELTPVSSPLRNSAKPIN
ncbi:Crp/Fnr family transcriptional regulator [Natronocella acetinitrilica]|uniref:Crp/Fnr family transcriptional regulator n=1 Tax=Natronocella acetinitrilica TaxID=414046 RepID=UPI00209CA4D0|nr:Crp/Fnr family transcriptional regulator [Natronocella acetinitrilica]